MRQKGDVKTLELDGVPKRRGRPPSGRALTGADRMRALRERRAAEGKSSLTVYVSDCVLERLDAYVLAKCGDVTKDVVVQKAIESFFRKR